MRTDDTDLDTVNNRLDVYDKNAKPIVKFYEGKGLLKRIDSSDTLAMSEDELKEAVGLK